MVVLGGLSSFSTARQSSSRAAAPVSTARPIKTVAPKPFVNVAKSRPNAFQKSHSPSRRSFYQQTALKNRNLNNKVNTIKVKSINTAKGKKSDKCFWGTRQKQVSNGLGLELKDKKELAIPGQTVVVPGGYTPGSDEGSKKLNELTELYAKLSKKVVISDEEEDLVSEDPSKQGRMSETEYEDVETEHAEEESSEVYLDVLRAAKILADAS
ncbi:hypothetical protein Tco_0837346 [Tanacetum coccineum]